MAWNSPTIFALISISILSGAAFIVSARYASEPILPLRVIADFEVTANYLALMLQGIAQFGLMVAVPIYFQATLGAGTAAAGAYLIPAFIGNLTGGLVAGQWIKRTGRFKLPTILAPIICIAGAVLCLTTWWGHTSILQSTFIFPGGLAMGITMSSTLVGAVAGVSEDDMAVATSGSYLFSNLGSVGGTSISPAVFQAVLKTSLQRFLVGVENGDEIMRRTLASIDYVQSSGPRTRALIVPAFVDGFHAVNVLSIACSVIGLVIAACSKGRRLKTEE